MNWTHLNRIAWKDFRRMSSLWFALVGFCIVYLAITTCLCLAGNHTNLALARYEMMSIFIPLLVIIHGIAWASVTFSDEHEDKTYGFLRALPVDAKHVFFGKLCYGINSTLLLALALGLACLIARWILWIRGIDVDRSGSSLQSEVLVGLGLLISAILPLAMTAGVFWSLRCKRPLLSLVLAAGTTMTVPFAVGFLSTTIVQDYPGAASEEADLAAIAGTITVVWMACVGLYIASRKLVESWFPNRSARPVLTAGLSPTEMRSSKSQGGFLRLLWLQRKQGMSLCLIIAGLAVLFSLWSGEWSPVPTTVLAGLLGVIVFRFEHESKRFRFLAQLGVSPSSYWLSRLLLPAAVALLMAMTLAFVQPQRSNLLEPWGVAPLNSYLFLLMAVLTTFTVGQLASISSPSTIVAIAVTLVTASVAWNWLWLCTVFHVPFWLSGPPLVGLPLLASFLRVPRWFRETGSWKQWIVPAMPMALLIITVPATTALYRVYSIPNGELPAAFAAVDNSIPETTGTQAYRRVFDMLPHAALSSYAISDVMKDQVLATWFDVHPTFEPELLKAVEEGGPIPEECRMNMFRAADTDPLVMSAAGLLLSAEHSLHSSKPKAKWDRYAAALQLAQHINDGKSVPGTQFISFYIEYAVYERLVPWAMHPENTAEAVQVAAEYVEEHRRDQPPWTSALRVYHQQLSELLEHPTRGSFEFDSKTERIAELVEFLPWEQARSRRLMNYAFAKSHDRLNAIENGRTLTTNLKIHYEDHILKRFAGTTFLGESQPDGHWQTYAYYEHLRRGTVYQLALIAHRLKHGDYPDDLANIRVAGQPLPDDFYWPGRKMLLATIPESHAAAGPYILSNRAAEHGNRTYSDGDNDDQHFLLPTLQPWDPQRFADRLNRSRKNFRAEPVVPTVDEDANEEGSVDVEMDNDE